MAAADSILGIADLERDAGADSTTHASLLRTDDAGTRGNAAAPSGGLSTCVHLGRQLGGRCARASAARGPRAPKETYSIRAVTDLRAGARV